MKIVIIGIREDNDNDSVYKEDGYFLLIDRK